MLRFVDNMHQLWWYVILIVCTTGSELEILSDCVGCKNDQPELNQFLKSQKIAHRLEYIKQQLINNLPVENPPKKNPKFDSLPDFLVNKLVHPNTAKESIASSEGTDQIERQTVLFSEEESTNCYGNLENNACLEFKLPEEISSVDLSSAALWFHKKIFSCNDNKTHNFTVIDNTTLNARNRNGRNLTFNQVQDNGGWYQIDVTALVKSWQSRKSDKHYSLILICQTCNIVKQVPNTTQENSETSFLLLNTDSEQNSRSKRGVECVADKDECCREDLYVDFSTLGEEYGMVLKPPRFNAYVCRGNCYPPSVADTHKPYATLLVILKLRKQNEYALPASCCTPTKFSSLQVLYAIDNSTIKKTIIPNMIVESCGCI